MVTRCFALSRICHVASCLEALPAPERAMNPSLLVNMSRTLPCRAISLDVLRVSVCCESGAFHDINN